MQVVSRNLQLQTSFYFRSDTTLNLGCQHLQIADCANRFLVACNLRGKALLQSHYVRVDHLSKSLASQEPGLLLLLLLHLLLL